MSFKSTELMADVVAAGPPAAFAGLLACTDSTRVGEDEKDCADSTRPPKYGPSIARREVDLALLRHDLRRALSERAAGR